MEGRTRVLGPKNGPLFARVLFVAEAPGRFGADVTGVPLMGDRTGRTFNGLLKSAGLGRTEIFVTNAVLCNPRDEAGRNDRPTAGEVENCSSHLKWLIRILDPEWVVTLGTVALEAATHVTPHGLKLRDDVGTPTRWFGRWLFALYHPGPRALIHRPLEIQRLDYTRLAALLTGDARTTIIGAIAIASGSATESES